MSVLIKGMNMPKCCSECYFCDVENDSAVCWHLLKNILPKDVKEKILDKCPLVDVPTPHGRLIDADKLEKALAKRWNVEDGQDFCNKAVWQELDNAPTVIEAEG